jgi:hypothetical protein
VADDERTQTRNKTRVIPSMDDSTRLLIWGIFQRLFGLVWCIVIIQLWPQLPFFCLSNGVRPVRDIYTRLAQDWPIHSEPHAGQQCTEVGVLTETTIISRVVCYVNGWWTRIRLFPSVFWICTHDWYIRSVCAVGVVSACVYAYGGVYSRLALFVCYVVYLSFMRNFIMGSPWDSLLFEVSLQPLL